MAFAKKLEVGMKKVLILCVVCSLILLLPFKDARASSFGLYIAPKIGLSYQGKTDSAYSGGENRAELGGNLSIGVLGGLAVGYDMQYNMDMTPIRIELETIFHSATSAKVVFNTTSVEQRVDIDTYLLNVFYDIHNASAFTPYIGGGIGFTEISHKLKVDGESFEGENRRFTFAGNIGVWWNIKESLVFDISYRYVYPSKSDITFDDSYISKSHPTAHDLIIALRYTF